MIRIRYLIFGFFLFFFVFVFSLFVYIFVFKDVAGTRDWEKFYIESKIQNVENYLFQADKRVRDLIETIQAICATKVINTNDRILLNTLFIPILVKEKYVKSVQMVLPNRGEYTISPSEKGWKTIYQVLGDKEIVRKTAIWAEDGVQMLEENIEEVPLTETLTFLGWYKKSTEISLTQVHNNRKGTPKIWITAPTFDENEKSILSLVAIAVGYEDSPFSTVCFTIDWSWLQNAVSSIYKDYNIETYILKDDLILGRVGLNYGSIDRKTFENYVNIDNIPPDIKPFLERNSANSERYQIYKVLGKVVVLFNYTFLYDYPLLCVCQVPLLLRESQNKWESVLLICTAEFLIAVILSILLTFFLEKPLEKANRWLENPTEREFSPKDFIFSDYYSLINKFNYILKFLKPLYVPSMSDSIPDVGVNSAEKLVISKPSEMDTGKDIFVFSEDGVGGITLKVFENLQRENIRLQKQIEVLNSFYSTQLNLDEKEKSRYISYLTGINESIMVVRKVDESPYEKLTKCVSILNSVLKLDYSIILKVSFERKTISVILSLPNIDLSGVSYDDIKDLLESLSWSEVILIRSILQDYRTSKFVSIDGGKSLIAVPLISAGDEKLVLISISCEERSWENKEELFVCGMSRILGICAELEDLCKISNKGICKEKDS